MFDPRPDLGRPDAGLLAALTAHAAAPAAPAIVVRTDSLDAVVAAIARLKALQAELQAGADDAEAVAGAPSRAEINRANAQARWDRCRRSTIVVDGDGSTPRPDGVA